MHFLEECVLQQWDLIQRQMLLAQKQVYRRSHAAKSNKFTTKKYQITKAKSTHKEMGVKDTEVAIQ